MNDALASLPPCTVIAHRGASRARPENTLEAIALALDLGAHAVEIDLKRTADGVVVLMHDATVDRTTQGSGRVHRMPYRALETLDAAAHVRPYPGRHIVPRLDQVLEVVAQRAWLNLELTNYPSPLDDLPVRVAQILKAHGYVERVWVSSFNPVALWRFHRALPQVPLGWLVLPQAWSLSMTPWMVRRLGVQAIHPHAALLQGRWWQRWQHRGLRIFTYTLNDEDELRRAFAAGVDGVFTDVPDRALQVRASIARCRVPSGAGAPAGAP